MSPSYLRYQQSLWSRSSLPAMKCLTRAIHTLAALAFLHSASARTLRVDFAPVTFDALGYKTESGQSYSLTRLDFILSEMALKKPDGSWLGMKDWFAYLSLREARDGFTLNGVPDGQYDAVRFQVGVRPVINQTDATTHPANHPLNPTVNTLWWGWQGGFVFMAIEGGWRKADGSISGYSFHVATDRQLMTVEVPCALDLSKDTQLTLKLDPTGIFKGITLSDERSSTHSRGEDELASQLHSNIEQAFTVASIKSGAPSADKDPPPAVLDPRETLVPFTFPSHFPRPALPGDNPLTKESITLGRSLFHDKRLSLNNTQSCADCHAADYAFSDPKRFSIGAEGKTGTRNAMPLFNLAWKQRFFWDGRAATIRKQVLIPIQDPVEMHSTLADVEKKTGLTSDRIARALEQYLLTLISDDAKIDRVIRGTETLTEQEQRGLELFNTEYDPRREQFGADCFHCHGGPMFQSVAFANNGLDREFKDAGLGAITHKSGDAGKFAVPSLRNVALTAPYMHDGRFTTLEEVVEHYDHGLQPSHTLDPNLAKHPSGGLNLSVADKSALVAFLKTLTAPVR